MTESPDSINSNVSVNSSYESQENRFIREHRSNVESDLIEITEDKLENILLKHIKQLNLKDSWFSPLSLFVASVATKTTATFNNALGIEAAVWEAIFLVVGAFAFFWFVRNVFLICTNWRKSSLDNLMSQIKHSQDMIEGDRNKS